METRNEKTRIRSRIKLQNGLLFGCVCFTWLDAGCKIPDSIRVSPANPPQAETHGRSFTAPAKPTRLRHSGEATAVKERRRMPIPDSRCRIEKYKIQGTGSMGYRNNEQACSICVVYSFKVFATISIFSWASFQFRSSMASLMPGNVFTP